MAKFLYVWTKALFWWIPSLMAHTVAELGESSGFPRKPSRPATGWALSEGIYWVMVEGGRPLVEGGSASYRQEDSSIFWWHFWLNFAGDQDLPLPWEGLNKDDIHPQEGKSPSGVKTSDIFIVCAFPTQGLYCLRLSWHSSPVELCHLFPSSLTGWHPHEAYMLMQGFPQLLDSNSLLVEFDSWLPVWPPGGQVMQLASSRLSGPHGMDVGWWEARDEKEQGT